LEVTDFNAIAGYGARASLGSRTIYVGEQGLFRKFGQNIQSTPQMEKLRSEGKTVILVGTEETIDGVIAIRDEIRPHAKEVVERLHGMRIKVAMLTGDNETTARAIAKESGIDEVKSDLRPEDKIATVKELEEKYGAAAMIGDGINDAPALARATVGIAVGSAGTDTAIEAADTALMADDLTKMIYAINLGKRAREISGHNIVFSLFVLAILIPSALIGVMTVAVAVFLHGASELAAVANGLRVAGGEM